MASPELQDLITQFAEAPSTPSATVDEQRASFEGMALPLPDQTTVGQAELGEVGAEWVAELTASPLRRVLYLHGGGYMMGSLNSHRHLAALVSRASGCVVLLLDYRLAPEHPFPAAVEDATAAFSWMREHGPDGHETAEGCFIAGESAGGGLTLAALLALREAGRQMSDAAVTISAWTDLALTGETLETNADVDPVVRNVDLVRPIAEQYLSGIDPKTPLASPLYADPHGLPPIFMQVGENEMLRSDTTRFADAARAAGVSVELDVVPEVPHFVQLFAPLVPEGQDAIERIGAFLKSH